MKITKGGFVRTTLLDYPGEIASVIFLPGCNLTCPYCHNPSIVKNQKEELENIEDIISIIEKRKNVLTAVVISGGEPTLYEDIKEYIDIIHGFGLKVKLDTNGTRHEVLKELNPDYIAMDLKTSLSKYSVLGLDCGDEIATSLNWLKQSGIEYEIRTTAAPFIFNRSDLEEIIPLLKGVDKYFITNFRNGEILNPHYNINTPYSEDEMEDFKATCQNAGIPCTLR